MPTALVEAASWDRLVGLVVKASASRPDLGFECRLRRDFPMFES